MTLKRWRLFFLALLLTLGLLPALAEMGGDESANPAEALDPDQIYAESAFLIDMDSGDILVSKNSKIRLYPASTTKIMTALLALESGIGLDDMITIPPEAADVPEGSSVINIKPGDQMTWRDLLYGLMLRSGNDAANAIAVAVSGSIQGFVEGMNRRASELGCTGTQFVNAHGYHNKNHYTTAQDLARIAYAAMQNPTFREIAAAPYWTLTVTRNGKTASTDAENRNLLVVPESEYYYPAATGIKTGHHNKAGRCVVASAEAEGVRLMAIVMDSPDEARQFSDAKKLFDYGFSQYEAVTMAELLTQLPEDLLSVDVENAVDGTLQLQIGDITNGDITRRINRHAEKSLPLALTQLRDGLQIQWNRAPVAPVKMGEVLGTLHYITPDGAEVTAELISPRDVEPLPSPTPAPTPSPQPTHSKIPAPLLWIVGLGILLGASAILLGLLKSPAARRRRHRRRAPQRRTNTSQSARRRKPRP